LEITGLQHSRVPNSRVPQVLARISIIPQTRQASIANEARQKSPEFRKRGGNAKLTLLDRVISRVVQQLLGPLHRHGALLRDEARELQPRLDGCLLGLEHPADEANGQRLIGGEVARRQADVLHPRCAPHELGQPAERAKVGGEADIDLLDGEARVPRADAHVGTARNIDGDADGHAVEDADYGLFALFRRSDGGLELDDVPTHDGCVPRGVPADARAERAIAGVLDVEAGRESAVADGGEDDGADIRVVAQAAEDGTELAPDRLREGVELLRTVDLDVRDEGGRRGNEEVGVGVVFEGRHGSADACTAVGGEGDGGGASRDDGGEGEFKTSR
ncbi:hypothetical protein CI238_04555, partial [Colletotrichum incanum]